MTKKTLFQHGTMQMLVEGLLEGTLPLSELLKPLERVMALMVN